MQKTLPKGWEWARLGDIASKEKFAIRMGPFGSQLKKHELVNNGIKVLWIENIVNNKFEWLDNKCITIDKFQTLKGFQVKPDDILTTTMGTIGRACVVPKDIGKAIISSHLLKISPDLHIANPEFIARYLSLDFCQKYFDRSSHGIVMKGLNTAIIKSLPTPLPPLPTQHKIVEILEEADNLRKLRRKADEKMKDLIPSLFIKMFGDPAKNPKRWEIKKLGEVTGIVSGSTPRTNLPEYWNGDILWITPADLSNLTTIEINDSERKITKEGYASCSTTILPIGTVLLSSRAPIGHLAIAGKAMCTNQGFKSLIPQTSVYSYYLYFALRYFKERLISLGSGATFKEISKSSVEKFEIPIPPLPLQQEFATLVEDIEAEKARQAESRKKLDELFNSLMQGAFTGELVA